MYSISIRFCHVVYHAVVHNVRHGVHHDVAMQEELALNFALPGLSLTASQQPSKLSVGHGARAKY